jgi:predicted ABC-type ATPase
MKWIQVVAGPNGSGKTTFAEVLFKKKNGYSTFINSDKIAFGLSAEYNDTIAFHAGRMMLGKIKELLKNNESFSFESTLAGKTWFTLLKKAKEDGYSITIYFIFLDNVKKNLQRIQDRVKQGGHPVDKITVVRRYSKAFKNFWNLYRPLCDNWYIFDNSTKKITHIISKEEFEALDFKKQSDFIKKHGFL